MTTNKDGVINISTLTSNQIIPIFEEIFKNHNIVKEPKKNTKYRDGIRDFLTAHNFVLKVKKLEGGGKIPYKYERDTEGQLVLYIDKEQKKNIDENKDFFQNININYNSNEKEVENSDKDDEEDDEPDDDKDAEKKDDEKNNDNPIPIEQADDENNQEAKRKAIETIKKVRTEVREKKAARIVELDNLKGLQEMTPIPEEKDKPQQQTKIQKFNQYKKVTRQNLTDNPKKTQVNGNTDTQITKEKDKPIKTLVKEKTEKQVTSEVKHGMFNHEKKQEAAFQKYAQGKNHMTRFNTNMAEALKIRINQGFSPFSH
jgi:hypothetical protein